MASPRAAITIFKRLSPQKIQNISSVRPRTPVSNTLTVESAYQNIVSPRFNIDTPNKKKIINDGILNQHGTVLGNGGFGTVYKAFYKGEEVAAKIIRNNKKTNSLKNMEKEASFLKHSNIVKVLKVDEGPALTLITMELCGNSLEDILENNSICKNEKIDIWKSIAKALKYCHRMGVVHADVKPKNVLMGSDNQPKLTDFGSAVFINELPTNIIFRGTPGYAAPEVVCGKMPTPLSDIYSLSILAWQMLSRKPPFAGLHKHTILYLTGKGETPMDNNIDDGFGGKYKDLYRKCWKKIPEDRPSLGTVVEELKKLKFQIVTGF